MCYIKSPVLLVGVEIDRFSFPSNLENSDNFYLKFLDFSGNSEHSIILLRIRIVMLAAAALNVFGKRNENYS